jgi:hypothetical protein
MAISPPLFEHNLPRHLLATPHISLPWTSHSQISKTQWKFALADTTPNQLQIHHFRTPSRYSPFLLLGLRQTINQPALPWPAYFLRAADTLLAPNILLLLRRRPQPWP